MGRLLLASIFHAIFSSYGDLEANVMNYMAVPVRHFFSDSLSAHYNISPTSGGDSLAAFELIYSGVASLFFIGVLVGGFAMGSLMDNYGRKGTATIIRSTLGALAAALMILGKWSNSIELFAAGQFIAGVVGALKTTPTAPPFSSTLKPNPTFSNPDPLKPQAQQLFSKKPQAQRQARSTPATSSTKMSDEMKDTAKEMGDKAKKLGQETKDAAKDKAEEAKESTKEKAEETKEDAKGMLEKVKDKLGDAKDAIVEKAEQAKDKAKELVGKGKEAAEEGKDAAEKDE